MVSDTAARTSIGRATLLVAAIALTAFSLRTGVTGFSPLAERIGAELRFGETVIGVVGTIVTASFAVFGLLSPALARRIGLEWAMVVALAGSTAGTVLRALSPTTEALIASTVLLFAGIGMANVLTIPLIKQWFPNRLGALSTTYSVLLQVGQVLAPIVAVAVAVPFGWRWALAIWAVPLAVAAILWSTAGGGRAPGATAARAPLDRATRRRYWRTPTVRGLVLLFSMTAFHTYTIVTWLPGIALDAGLGEASGAALLSFFSAFGIAAGFVVPALALRLPNPRAIVIACVALLAVGYALLAIDAAAFAWAAAAALGIGVSTFPLCLTLVHRRASTPEGATFLSGAMQGVGYGVACIGPLVVGWIVAGTGTWMPVYVGLIATLGITLYGGIVASRPSSVEADAEAIRD
ncbi:CynX/NimT family MFS transporter [Agromyces seonyuensis]|uniref:MFS transporter n=1 Tax=Agromyces seonyuensis TaxID=2662446 RepID=A0A6I4NVX1_9MICO|nr:MFS transporter [Agromyces seonyuensis]MWB98490.1 MFS transporter [Agromyces seonyuensis]